MFCDHKLSLTITAQVRVCEACFEKGVQRHNEKVAQSRQAVQEKKVFRLDFKISLNHFFR